MSNSNRKIEPGFWVSNLVWTGVLTGVRVVQQCTEVSKFVDRPCTTLCIEWNTKLRAWGTSVPRCRVCVQASLALGLARHLMSQILYRCVPDMLYPYTVSIISKVFAPRLILYTEEVLRLWMCSPMTARRNNHSVISGSLHRTFV